MTLPSDRSTYAHRNPILYGKNWGGAWICDGKATFEPDPYMEDVEADSTPVWMCACERYESAMDI